MARCLPACRRRRRARPGAGEPARPASRRGSRRRRSATRASRARSPPAPISRATSLDGRGRHAALPLRERRGELRVECAAGSPRRSRRSGACPGAPRAEVLAPVDPAAQELPVVTTLRDDHAGTSRAAARPRCPATGDSHQSAIDAVFDEPHVDGADLRPPLLPLDDPLRVRVEVVARLEVRRQEQDEPRIGVVRRRAVEAAPERVARAGGGRADVGVRVVSVDPPGVQDALRDRPARGRAGRRGT